MAVTLNASTSTGYIQTADTSGNLALQSNGTTQFTVSSTGAYGQLKSGTAVASTSGTSIDFTSIPSWVKRITVMFSGVSTNGTSNWLIQVGSGSIETSGYLCSASQFGTTVSSSQFTAGFGLTYGVATAVSAGSLRLENVSGNTWVANGTFANTDSAATRVTAGNITLSGALDSLRITTVGGTNTFDAGTINILYEG